MRRRLLVAMLTVCCASLVVVVLPLVFVAQSLIEQDFDQRLQRNSDNLAAAIRVITAREGQVRQSEFNGLVPADRRAVYTPANGPVLSAGHVAGPLRSRTVTVAGGRLVFYSPLDLLQGRVRRVWLLIAGLGVAALAFAVVVALWAARRFTVPLDQLARRAERIGAGDLRPSATRFAVPELQRLATVLDWSAAQLDRILERERRRSRDTSHQLRTPLTALSIRLEEIRKDTTDPHVAAHVDAALQQVHRLTEVAASSLVQGDGTFPSAQRSDAAAVLNAQATEWEPAFRRAGRKVVVQAPDSVPVDAPPAPVGQAVSALVENALVHGAGTVTLAARAIGDYAVLEVCDEGSGVAPTLAPRVFERGVSGADGTGLGLALARSLVEGCGGRLELARAVPATFAIYLRAQPR